MVRDPRLRPFRGVAAVLVALLLLQAGSAAVLFFGKLGPGAGAVRDFYLGSEAGFAGPKTAGGLLEVALPHLVAMPLALFVVAHLVGFAGVLRRRAFRALAGVSFGCALAGVAGGFAIRYAWPGLAWVKIAAFGGLESALVAWLLLVVYAFFWPVRARDGERLTASARGAREAGSGAMANEAGGCPR